jgi:hypothetical protein
MRPSTSNIFMKRFLAPLTVALLFGLVVITVVLGGVAFGAIVARFEAEAMARTGGDIIERDDGTSDVGIHIRFTANADAADTVSQQVPSPLSTQVNQIQIRSRQSSGGVDDLAVYVNGTAAGNRVGDIQPNAGSTWTTQTVTLQTPLSVGSRPTIYIGPNQPNNNFVALDWFELHTGTTQPPPGGDTTAPNTTIDSTTNPSSSGTDTDGSVSFAFSGTDNVGVTGFDCTLNLDAAADNWQSCSSPKAYTGLSDGSYTFKVRAKDAAGNVDGTPASRSFTVDVPALPDEPGVGTGFASECDVTINPGTSTLQTALNNVPATISTNDYVICMRDGVYGGLAQETDFGNTGDNSTHRLVLKSYPGEQAKFRGYLNAKSSDTWYVIRDLYLDARYEAPASSGGLTNQGNPNMRPVYAVAGSDVLFTNNEIDGGNDDPTVVPGSNPYNKRSTCIGYHQNPIRSVVSQNWIHNCGVLAANSAGGPDSHGLYTNSAGNGGTVSDNLIWGNAENGISGYGSVGPHGVIFEDNILWDNGRNMSIGGAASGNTVRRSLFLDPLIGNDQNLRGNSTGAPTDVIDNCLDTPIKATNVNTSGNVIVSDASMSASGDPHGNFSITTTRECREKYHGTMLGSPP